MAKRKITLIIIMRLNRIFLIVVLLGSVFLSTLEKSKAFSDVSADFYFYKAVEYLSAKKIISGFDDGSFRPQDEVNRSSALKMIIGAVAKKVATEEIAVNFSDIDKMAWYFPFIKTGLKLKIVQGFSDGTFRPAAGINKVEYLQMLFKTFNEKLPRVGAEPYEDVMPKAWYAPLVARAKELKLINSENDGLFHAERVLNRAMATEILYRYLYLKEKKWPHFVPSENWPVLKEPSLNLEIKYPFDFVIRKRRGDSLTLVSAAIPENIIDDRRVPRDFVSLTIEIYRDKKYGSKYELLEDIQNYAISLSKMTLRELRFGPDSLTGFLVHGFNGNEGVMDLYVILPDQKIIGILGTYGVGRKSEELKEILYLMEMSFTYRADSASNYEKILTEARSQIFVSGVGKKVLETFPEPLIIMETDTIGTGSGPVDYYYCEIFDVSIKYQRSGDVILGIKEGKTTKF